MYVYARAYIDEADVSMCTNRVNNVSGEGEGIEIQREMKGRLKDAGGLRAATSDRSGRETI